MDRGDRLRGILNLGREDVVVDALIPETAALEVLGASSDHLIVDITDMSPPPQVGDVLRFHMGYAALLAAMTSEYVEKQLMFEKPLSRRERIYVSVEPGLKSVVDELNLTSRFAALGLSVAESHDDAIRLRVPRTTCRPQICCPRLPALTTLPG